ncbi:MAG: hypothetical protein NZ822_02775, partial [Patescibacteria group bacterium]|nr:hypothetical protein [Patescibacteria group bacterium]
SLVEDREGLRYSLVYKVEIPVTNINEDLIEEAVRNALKKFHSKLEESSQKLFEYLKIMSLTQEPQVEIEGKERGELSGTILPSVIDQQFIEDVMERVEESKILRPESKKEIKSLLAILSDPKSVSPELDEELKTPEGEANRAKLAKVKAEIFDSLDKLLTVTNEEINYEFLRELKDKGVISIDALRTIMLNIRDGNYGMIGYLINIISTDMSQRKIIFTSNYFQLIVRPLVAAFANYFIEVLANDYLFHLNRGTQEQSKLGHILSILDVDHSQSLDNTENANGGNN